MPHSNQPQTTIAAANAIILAAGEGLRLRGAFGKSDMDDDALGNGAVEKTPIEKAPKGFIEINGETLISRSIRMMRDHGVRTFVIVAGYAGEYYEDLAKRLAKTQPGINVHITHNRQFRTTTTLHSLAVGIQALREIDNLDQQPRSNVETNTVTTNIGATIIAESDLLYESRATLAVQNRQANNVLLTSGPSHAGDEVYVATQNGRLCGLSKTRETLGGEIIGELVGLTRVSSASLDWLAEYADARSAKGVRTYEDALTALSTHHPVHCELIEDLVWTEIDNADHLHRATHTVGPWIAKYDRAVAAVTADMA